MTARIRAGSEEEVRITVTFESLVIIGRAKRPSPRIAKYSHSGCGAFAEGLDGFLFRFVNLEYGQKFCNLQQIADALGQFS